jgi:hypothetical protein
MRMAFLKLTFAKDTHVIVVRPLSRAMLSDRREQLLRDIRRLAEINVTGAQSISRDRHR